MTTTLVIETTEYTLEIADVGVQGPPGAGATGGSTGQVLAKNSNTSGDTLWKTLTFSDVGADEEGSADAAYTAAVATAAADATAKADAARVASAGVAAALALVLGG